MSPSSGYGSANDERASARKKRQELQAKKAAEEDARKAAEAAKQAEHQATLQKKREEKIQRRVSTTPPLQSRISSAGTRRHPQAM